MNFNFKKLTVLQNTKIIDAMNILDKNFKKIILVINKNKKLLGTITDGDIRRGILIRRRLRILMRRRRIRRIRRRI